MTAEGGTFSGRRCPTASSASRLGAENQAPLSTHGVSSASGQVGGLALTRRIAVAETSTVPGISRPEGAEVLSRGPGSAGLSSPIGSFPSGVVRLLPRRRHFTEASGQAVKTCRCILAGGLALTET